MARIPKKWHWLILPCIVIAGLCSWQLVELSKVTLWIGFSDLNVEFFIVDATTNEPVPDAEIKVYPDTRAAPQSMNGNITGMAQIRFKDCKMTGRDTAFSKTKRVYEPIDVRIAVSAPGYAASETFDLSWLLHKEKQDFSGPTPSCKVAIKLTRIP
ncbi:MAG: hypothetical protein HY040_14915 [Planctomycetes bacterium]|nr:hypothetical protein [Planctomycetota bacterium]